MKSLSSAEYLRSKGLHQLADLRSRGQRKEPQPTLLEAILSGVGFLVLVFYGLWSLGGAA